MKQTPVDREGKENKESSSLASLRQQLEEARKDTAALIQVLKSAYRKHHLGQDNIGWDELSDQMCDALCNVMGDKEFHQWLAAMGSPDKTEEEKDSANAATLSTQGQQPEETGDAFIREVKRRTALFVRDNYQDLTAEESIAVHLVIENAMLLGASIRFETEAFSGSGDCVPAASTVSHHPKKQAASPAIKEITQQDR